MTLSHSGFLLDVNLLMALTDEVHQQHSAAMMWFDRHQGEAWATCGFTEAGFIRLKTNPRLGGRSVDEAGEILQRLVRLPGHRFWAVAKGWTILTEPFRHRVYGHQQVTDAYLLGLAVDEGGVLVTMDKGIRYLAGERYAESLHVIEQPSRM